MEVKATVKAKAKGEAKVKVERPLSVEFAPRLELSWSDPSQNDK